MAMNLIIRIVIRWAFVMFVLAGGLILVAGTTHLWTLNAYTVVLAPSLLAMMLAIAPQLMRENRKADERSKSDGAIRLAHLVLFVVTLVVTTLDAGRLHLSSAVPVALRVIGLVGFVAASGLQSGAMRVNSFYSPVIYIQTERGHRVVTRGPYRMLRPPAYFANIVAVPASALAIGSWLGLIPAAACCALTIWRARKADSFLPHHLAGYMEYMLEVRGGGLRHVS